MPIASKDERIAELLRHNSQLRMAIQILRRGIDYYANEQMYPGRVLDDWGARARRARDEAKEVDRI